MPTYRNAPAVMRIGEELIKEYHSHLIGTKIRWIFKEKASIKGGKYTYGTARLVQGLQAFLEASGQNPDITSDVVESYFVIEIAEDTWATLDAHEKKALVDHELCHCGMVIKMRDGEEIEVLTIIPHDIEEFRAVVERHGLWSQDMREFAKATKRHLVK